MTYCRICGMLGNADDIFGECVICEDCAGTFPDFISLNTQPEGCSCRDCQRYGKKECPYPGTNPTMCLCNSFYMDVARHDAAVCKEERERVLKSILTWIRFDDGMIRISAFREYLESLRNGVEKK